MSKEAVSFFDHLADNQGTMITNHPVEWCKDDHLVSDVFDYFEEATFTFIQELGDFSILGSDIIDDVHIHIFSCHQPDLPNIVSVVFFAENGEILTYREGIEEVKKGYEYAQKKNK